jgi:hypothetical protein
VPVLTKSRLYVIDARVILVLATLLAGCVMVPAGVQTSRSEVGPLRLSEERKIAVLFSTDFSPETAGWLGEDMAECIGRALQKALPGGSVIQQKEFYGAVFPGLTPKQVLLRTDTLPMLVARPEIKQHLEQLGLHYLILVGARVRGDAELGLSSGGAAMVWDQGVKMTGMLFELGQAQIVGSVTAEAAGKGAGVALLFVIPLGGGTDGIRPSCKALGAEVVQMIRGASERDGR